MPGSGKVLLQFLVWGFLLDILLTSPTFAQDLDMNIRVPYVPTPPEVVDKMLDVADVGPGDYVIDLGSGDGRIVIEAARRGAVGHGVDIDSALVRKAEENSRKADVANRVTFLKEDVFDTDFSRATVVTMYLLTSMNLRLRSSLLGNLKPGTRLVSHDFKMGEWKPDKHFTLGEEEVFFWVIPAKVNGRWQWKINGKSFTMTVKQKFQEIRLKVRVENNPLKVSNAVLSGRRISFTAVNPRNNSRYVYHGLVKDFFIEGTVQSLNSSQRTVKEWSATITGMQPPD